MFCFLRLCFGTLVRLFRLHHSLLVENLALRQQLVVLKRRHPRRKAGLVRQAFLAARSSMLVNLETVSPRRHTRNGCPLAPRRIPLVLENDFEGQKPRRSKTDIERSTRSDLPNDGRESSGKRPRPVLGHFITMMITFFSN